MEMIDENTSTGEPCVSCIHDEPGYVSVIGTCDHLCSRHWHCKPGKDAHDYKRKPVKKN